jgi:RNA polymerase sigma-70 factor (ECF subfamily)
MGGEDFQEDAVLAAAKTLKFPTNYAGSPDLSALSDTGANLAAVESDSVEALFQRHNQRIFRTAYRVTGNAADAEDVLQTVFLRVARGQENTAAAENAEAYFSRAAVNASLDLLRSKKRSKTVGIDDVESDASVSPFVAQQNPETHHEDHELRKLIREAVSKLGDTAGQMFALRYFEGYGNAEIAKLMNTSALVVGVTLHRARTRLRKEIGQYLRC